MSKTVAGVTFSGTKGGKLDEAKLPSDGYKQHYLYPGDTKSESSYPVVDADGFLRRGNVSAAWSLGGRGGVDGDAHDRKMKKLGKEFDSNPIPEDAYDAMIEIQEDLSFHASTPDDIDFSRQEFVTHVGTGFNKHGVRTNTDAEDNIESVDVVFEAMEAGPPDRRNGVRITNDFLREVAAKDYAGTPHLKDHDDGDTFSKIGTVREAWFSEHLEKLLVMVRTPNIEGSQNHQEAIARYTHEPPSITDGSLGFGENYEVEMNDDGEPEMVDGTFREFSTTNFPGGYDDGGVNRAFAEALPHFSKHGGEDMDYEFEVGDWVNRDWQGGTVTMKIRDRTKDSFTVDGNTISGDDGEPVYKGEQWEDGEFTGQMIAAPQGSLSSTSAPSDMSETAAYLAMNFAADEDELDSVYSEWADSVNMTASQLEQWADHPCADTASRDPEAVRERNLRLLETNKSDWDADDIADAKRTISFIERMGAQEPDNPSEGGNGTCPSEWAVSMLNWAFNPFDGMPDGEPNPEQDNSIMTETITFALEGVEPDPRQRERVYSEWTSMVNMSEEQMELWERHPCSDAGVDGGEARRDEFMMLMGQPAEEWDQNNVEIANRSVAYMREQMEMDPENPQDGGPGTCPSRWAVGLLNRGHNPFDSFPTGNPTFSKESVEFDADSASTVTVDTIQF